MIPQYEPLISNTVSKDLAKYFEEGGWITEFKKTRELEDVIKKVLNIKFCSIINNGTISLSLALLALGIKPGDEVLVPDLTMIATANAVRLIGAYPIFVDVDKKSLCMDKKEAAKKCSFKVRAIIYVTLNGRSGDLEGIKALCKEKNIPLITDDAQSFGSDSATKGEISSFSFSMPKVVTTGQGGCLCTNNEDLYKKILQLRDFGRSKSGVDNHPYFGINSKFTDVQAVIGLNQLKNIEWRLNRKKEIYSIYRDCLSEVQEIKFLPVAKNQVPWFVDVYLEDKDKLIEYLKGKEIGTRPIYPPIHTQGDYYTIESFPISTEYSRLGLWLPSSLTLTDRQIEKICKIIKEFYD